MKENAEKFGVLKIPEIKLKFELITFFIQTNYLNQYVICFMAQ